MNRGRGFRGGGGGRARGGFHGPYPQPAYPPPTWWPNYYGNYGPPAPFPDNYPTDFRGPRFNFSRNSGFSRNIRNNRHDFKPYKKFNRGRNNRSKSDKPGMGRNDDPGKRLSEENLAITEYVSTLPGFSGIIKARYSDFHVNEIDKDGNVAKLTSREIPKPLKPEDVEEKEEGAGYNTQLLPQETWEQIAEIVKKRINGKKIKADATEMTKDERTKVHVAVKQQFGTAIVSSTVNEAEKKFLCFTLYDRSAKQDRRVKWLWPGEWLHFLVHKENMDTMQAAIELSNCLNMKPSRFTYAGTKDRRAKTTQWFCIKKIQPQRLSDAIRNSRNITVGNYKFSDKPLALGQLNGNRFRIALRNVKGEDDVIDAAMSSLRDNGFINYYGLQRFGSSMEVPTHKIGLALLLGKWKEAVELILKPHPGDHRLRNPRDALRKLGRDNRRTVEGRLLVGLANHGENDFVSALSSIPRNMRLLYLHSYQSFVWNSMVSKRIREWGLVPHTGDLVLDEGEVENEVIDEIIDDGDDENEGNQDQEDSSEAQGDDAAAVENPKIAEEKPVKRQAVKVLTQEDIDSGKYTMFDIVMPLPGFDISYPENECGEWYTEFLSKDELSSETMKQKVKSYSLSGAYRKVLAKPETVSWKTVKYNSPTDLLIISDLEELSGKKDITEKPDGKYKALIIDFCLSSSIYATMALREVLKGDTSTESQAKLNKYHDESKTEESVNEIKEETVDTTDVGENVEKRKLEDDADESEAKKTKVD